MGWESLTTIGVTSVVGGFIMLQIRSQDSRMSSLEIRVSGIEQRLARIEGLLKGYFVSTSGSDTNPLNKGRYFQKVVCSAQSSRQREQ